jgi:hypothetical protein
MVTFIKVNLNNVNIMEKEFSNILMVAFTKVNLNKIKGMEKEF